MDTIVTYDDILETLGELTDQDIVSLHTVVPDSEELLQPHSHVE